MTILRSDGASTLDQAVFNSLETVWEDTKVNLPAVVLPLVSFNCLLGMSWICAVGANLKIEEGYIQLKEKKFFYRSVSIHEHSKVPAKTTLFADKAVEIPPQTFTKVPIAPFDQGSHGGMVCAALKPHLLVNLPVYQESIVTGELADWHVYNSGSRPIQIQQGQQIEIGPLVNKVRSRSIKT